MMGPSSKSRCSTTFRAVGPCQARPDDRAGLASVETPDPLTYNFSLKPNLTFHDGTPIDAAAAKANFDRVLDPALGSPRRSELAPVDTVTVTGPLTFTIKLKAPYAPLLQVLSNRAGMLVSPTAVKSLGADFATKAVGAGPYKLVNWTKNAELVLEAFPGYWRGAPAIERVVFRRSRMRPCGWRTCARGPSSSSTPSPPRPWSTGTRSQCRAEAGTGVGIQRILFQHDTGALRQPQGPPGFTTAIDKQAILRAVYSGRERSLRAAFPFHGLGHDTSFAPYKPAWMPRRNCWPRPGSQPRAGDHHRDELARPGPHGRGPASAGECGGFKVEIKQIDATSLITVLRQKDFDLCMSPWSGARIPTATCSTISRRPVPTTSWAIRATRSPTCSRRPGVLRRRPIAPSSTASRSSDRGRCSDALSDVPGHAAGFDEGSRLAAISRRCFPPAIAKLS